MPAVRPHTFQIKLEHYWISTLCCQIINVKMEGDAYLFPNFTRFSEVEHAILNSAAGETFLNNPSKT